MLFPVTCSVHFRNCEEAAWEDVQTAVQATLAEQPELRLTRGRKVLELRPEVRSGFGSVLTMLTPHRKHSRSCASPAAVRSWSCGPSLHVLCSLC